MKNTQTGLSTSNVLGIATHAEMNRQTQTHRRGPNSIEGFMPFDEAHQTDRLIDKTTCRFRTPGVLEE